MVVGGFIFDWEVLFWDNKSSSRHLEYEYPLLCFVIIYSLKIKGFLIIFTVSFSILRSTFLFLSNIYRYLLLVWAMYQQTQQATWDFTNNI